MSSEPDGYVYSVRMLHEKGANPITEWYRLLDFDNFDSALIFARKYFKRLKEEPQAREAFMGQNINGSVLIELYIVRQEPADIYKGTVLTKFKEE